MGVTRLVCETSWPDVSEYNPAMIKARWLALLFAVTGCAVFRTTMVRMEPTPAAGQDVRFTNGTPIVSSPGPRFDVVVSPKTGPTGRYELTDRVGLMVGVYNHTDRRTEVAGPAVGNA